tara:strand:- start:280 stop:852 length:573 start_codon:yes stop_codon:yes gene_type:complete
MIFLLVPIGAPGSGKTTLRILLEQKIDNFYYTERDYQFSEVRKTNSQRKTRRILFDRLEEFFQKIKTENEKYPNKKIVVYFDSSNSKKMGRQRFYESINPDKIIEINFIISKEILLERVKDRIHPTFPKEPTKQKKIIDTIFPIIEYSNPKRMTNQKNNTKIEYLFITAVPLFMVDIFSYGVLKKINIWE